jgi:hypothetical protein
LDTPRQPRIIIVSVGTTLVKRRRTFPVAALFIDLNHVGQMPLIFVMAVRSRCACTTTANMQKSPHGRHSLADRFCSRIRSYGEGCTDEEQHACHRHQQPKPVLPALRSGPFDMTHDIPPNSTLGASLFAPFAPETAVHKRTSARTPAGLRLGKRSAKSGFERGRLGIYNLLPRDAAARRVEPRPRQGGWHSH